MAVQHIPPQEPPGGQGAAAEPAMRLPILPRAQHALHGSPANSTPGATAVTPTPIHINELIHEDLAWDTHARTYTHTHTENMQLLLEIAGLKEGPGLGVLGLVRQM